MTDVERVGDVLLRPWRPWSATVMRLLAHLADEGFAGAPRPVGDGRAADGREAVTYVAGDDAPDVWSDDAAHALGVLLRDLHAATATFETVGAQWLPWWGRSVAGGPLVVGHCDAAPWNVVARDGRPVALVDWDTAGPVSARCEVAYATWLNARLFDDDVAARDGLPDIAARARTAAAIAHGYGLARADRVALLDAMVEVAVRSAAQEAVDARVTRHGDDPLLSDTVNGGLAMTGRDLLWSLAWRTRAAAFLLRHRDVFEAAFSA